VRINQRESFCLAGEKWQGGERIVRMVDKWMKLPAEISGSLHPPIQYHHN
jgi:hypothetical protein